MPRSRVFVYIDGSNFYHIIKNNYGFFNVDFVKLSNLLLDKKKGEVLNKIKYFNAPVRQQDDPEGAKNQQRFLSHLQKEELVEIFLGNIVKRPIGKIAVMCKACKVQIAVDAACPKCARLISLEDTYRHTEKGVDVKLAITLMLDAINDEYDVALLISSDADFVPAIQHIIRKVGKRVIYCHFPHPKTSELIQNCSDTIFIERAIAEEARLDYY